MQEVSVVTLNRLLAEGEVEHLIDVRSPEEFADVRPNVGCIRNVPLERIESLDLPKDATIYLSCRSGARSGMAQKKLAALGYRHVINVMGGVIAWQQAGYPTASGPDYR
ncbi:MAG TPA: rhodanese-like domain-containing protein [Mariprofundaceae bacterium]|nr:rhodanese-like domain-containing protein [Mariprofundaceae bacterium]